MFWKLIGTVLPVAGMVVIAVLDYVWWDKRTKRFKQARSGLMVILGVSAVVSGVGAYLESRDREAEAKQLAARLDELRLGQAMEAERAETRHSEQASEIGRLRTMLDPFLVLARRRAPSTDDASALQALAGRMEALERSTAAEIDSVRTAVHRSEYRAPASGIVEEATRGLASVADVFRAEGLIVEINISQDPTEARDRIAADLRAVLRSAGLNVGSGGVHFGPGISQDPAYIQCASNHTERARALAHYLRKLIPLAVRCGTLEPGTLLRIWVRGTPRFDASGRVTF